MVAYGVSTATRAWAEANTSGRVVRVRRLRGGITSEVHLLVVDLRDGVRKSVVLRQWAGVPAAQRADVLAHESRVLQLLEATSIPAPRLIAVSDGAMTDGVAALLMTRVPGQVDLAPVDPDRWVRQMAQMLCAIQQLGFSFPTYEPSPRGHPEDVPRWVERPELWRKALAILQLPPPSTPPCFTHSDFQHFNVLWSRDRLSGVVDWVHPVVSSPDLDVGHCRLNLTILHGLSACRDLPARLRS